LKKRNKKSYHRSFGKYYFSRKYCQNKNQDGLGEEREDSKGWGNALKPPHFLSMGIQNHYKKAGKGDASYRDGASRNLGVETPNKKKERMPLW